MKKKIITILSTSVILSTFISALTLNANTELSSQNSCKDFQKFVLTKGYDYNYKYDLNTNGTINVLDLCRQKKYELIKNNITTTTTTKVTAPLTTTPITTKITTTTQVTTTTKPQTTTTVVTTAPPVTTTVQTTPIDTASWGLSSQDIQGAVSMINEQRRINNVEEVKLNSLLCAVANQRAIELNESYGASRPDGSSFLTLYQEYGITKSKPAQLWNKGLSNYIDAVNSFVMLDTFRTKYILNVNYKEVGIGFNSKGQTWSICFN